MLQRKILAFCVCSRDLLFGIKHLLVFFTNFVILIVLWPHPRITCFLYCHNIWYVVNSKILWLEMNIQVSKLSIYREEDIKFITPKMSFSVFLYCV